MKPLSSQLRAKLERTVVEARDTAETGARIALQELGVHHHEPYGHMSPEQRKLRNHLRARARQLGDKQDRAGKLSIDHLVRECAYEYWHRMLFARFLAENGLLFDPTHEVIISLEDAKELGEERGMDQWQYASRCAQGALPRIFRPDDPLLQVSFASEHKLKLESLLDGLEPAVFSASDALGWVYQFWQSRRKDQVNAAGAKIGADELPAVTQLFTEPYMVQFLIHNTLGAWHAGKVLAARPELAAAAETEQQLREAVALPGVSWDYLRFVREEGHGPWRPAAGVFGGWARRAAELKVLDPCCGSGHFLVGVLQHLVPLRMTEEGLSAKDAVDAVIRDNLHGLEIDERCTQIAAFAVGMAAWTYPGASGFRQLPDIRIACSGIAPNAKKEEWQAIAKLAADAIVSETDNSLLPDPKKETMWHVQLKNGMETLYELFQQAPVLGSLIDPRNMKRDLFTADFEELGGLLHDALGYEQSDIGDDAREMSVAAKGVADAVKLLAGQYHLVITNVPYLGRGSQVPSLHDHIQGTYPHAKENLATALTERAHTLLSTGGGGAVVTPQSWLMQARYKKLRQIRLGDRVLALLARLGPRAFYTIGGEVVNVVLAVHLNNRPTASDTIQHLDVTTFPDPKRKAQALAHSAEPTCVSQLSQLRNPDYRIGIPDRGNLGLIEQVASSVQGLATSDDPQFTVYFWEVLCPEPRWEGLMGGFGLQKCMGPGSAFCCGNKDAGATINMLKH